MRSKLSLFFVGRLRFAGGVVTVGSAMSKAFTKESDQDPKESFAPPRRSPLPPGVPNYMTPDGAQRLRGELEQLIQVDCHAALKVAGDENDRRRQLLTINQRIRLLNEILASAEIVPPPTQDTHRVRFGAAVTIREQNGSEQTYRIVGADEADWDNGRVSWLSPIAKTLVNAQVGDAVSLRSPTGVRTLRILRVEYLPG